MNLMYFEDYSNELDEGFNTTLKTIGTKLKTGASMIKDRVKKTYDLIKKHKTTSNLKIGLIKTQREFYTKMAKQHKADGDDAKYAAALAKAKELGIKERDEKRNAATQTNKIKSNK